MAGRDSKQSLQARINEGNRFVLGQSRRIIIGMLRRRLLLDAPGIYRGISGHLIRVDSVKRARKWRRANVFPNHVLSIVNLMGW